MRQRLRQRSQVGNDYVLGTGACRPEPCECVAFVISLRCRNTRDREFVLTMRNWSMSKRTANGKIAAFISVGILFGIVAEELFVPAISHGTDTRCKAVTKAMPESSTAIGFVVRCRRSANLFNRVAIHTLTIDPDRDIRGFRRRPMIRRRHHRGESMSCHRRRSRSGNGKLRCSGWIRTGTEIVGRFNVAADERCITATRFSIDGGIDCDLGSRCPAVRVRFESADKRPSGCT
jgi:hypothetical protein